MADAEGSSAHSYEVLGKLADGGATEIFLARARGPGAVERFVVLKRLRRSLTEQLDLVKEFLDRAQRASQLQHPNIAQVFEVGKLGGSYFLALEFINGETLAALVKRARERKIQVPVRAVLTIASAMAAGLHHAHERRGTDGQPLGIVHGELSLTNTLVSQEGIVKLLDFGLARAGEQGPRKVTPYVSPEQCSGEPLDRRSDLFSLGVVLWELLTLERLYWREGNGAIRLAIVDEEPEKPSAKRYDVPPELDALVLKLLAKDPADRYQDADELLAAIEALAQKLGFLLSTADLSRMVRLWFGTKSEPIVDPASPEAPAPLVVTSEQVPDELAPPSTSPIDEALDAVRSAAALITARATARAGSTTGRQDRPTVPPELMENPNENFEQLRDRILARARQKKETLRNQIVAAGGAPSPDAAPAEASTAPAHEAPSTAPAHEPGASSGPDRHTRTTVQAPITMIEEAVRRAGLADPVEGAASDAKRTPDHVNGTSREAPPATADLARPASARSSAVVSGTIGGTTDRVSAAPDVADADATTRASDTSAAARSSGATSASTASGATSASTASGATTRASDTSVAARSSGATSSGVASDAKSSGAASVAFGETATARTRSSDEAGAARTRSSDETATGKARMRPTDERATAARNESEDEATRRERAYARASTAEIAYRRRGRPAWILPAIGVVATFLVLIVTIKLHGGDNASEASATAPRAAGVPAEDRSSSSVVGGAPTTVAGASGAAAAASGPSETTGPNAPSETTGPNAPGETTDTAAASGVSAASAGPGTTGAAATAGASTTTAAQDSASTTTSGTTSTANGTPTSTVRDTSIGAPASTSGPDQRVDRGESSAHGQATSTQAAGTRTVRKPDKHADSAQTRKEPERSIEELYAAGDYASTNVACTKTVVFTADKLQKCALAACQTKNAVLATRWVRAISKSARGAIVDACLGMGLALQPESPAGSAPSPAPAPPAESPPADASP